MREALQLERLRGPIRREPWRPDLTGIVVARAPVDDDTNVRDRLEHAVRERKMDSVVDAGRCEIQSRPPWRRITCEYAVPLEILPGWTRVVPFRIDTEQPYVTRPPGESGLGGR